MGVPVFLVQYVSALTTVDGCVCISGVIWQCSDQCGWVCLSIYLLEHVTALITVDLCVCVSCGKCQCSDHCGWVCLCLWWNISVLLQLWMGVSVSLVEHVSGLTIEDGFFKHVSAVTPVDG